MAQGDRVYPEDISLSSKTQIFPDKPCVGEHKQTLDFCFSPFNCGFSPEILMFALKNMGFIPQKSQDFTDSQPYSGSIAAMRKPQGEDGLSYIFHFTPGKPFDIETYTEQVLEGRNFKDSTEDSFVTGRVLSIGGYNEPGTHRHVMEESCTRYWKRCLDEIVQEYQLQTGSKSR